MATAFFCCVTIPNVFECRTADNARLRGSLATSILGPNVVLPGGATRIQNCMCEGGMSLNVTSGVSQVT